MRSRNEYESNSVFMIQFRRVKNGYKGKYLRNSKLYQKGACIVKISVENYMATFVQARFTNCMNYLYPEIHGNYWKINI